MKAIATMKVLRRGVIVEPGTPFELAPVEVARATILGWTLIPDEKPESPISGNNNIQPKEEPGVKTENKPKISPVKSAPQPKTVATAKPAPKKG